MKILGFHLQIVQKTVRKLRATMASEHHGTYKYTVTNLQISCFLIINFIVVSDDAQTAFALRHIYVKERL